MSAIRPFVIRHSSLVIPRRNRRGGFALLITITLLAFLVLLLVSLASLTRVETQVAANNQQLSQARQNALMALNIAVGQLQKYAGPDQRTTARADLENGPGKTNSQWIGVYGSSVTGNYTETPSALQTALTNSSNVNSYGSTARLLNWLVSGNETTAFNPDWSTGNVGSSGQITGYPSTTSTTSITFRPAPTTALASAGTVANLTATTAAADPNITITNAAGTARPARLLVGQNSVTSAVDASGKPVDYVVAPAVDISVAASTVPGAGTSGTVTVGRYAWWVGDEGLKARINLPLAGTNPAITNSTDILAEKQKAFTNSTRAAVELMATTTPNLASATPALNAARIDTVYDPSFPSVSKVVSTGQSALAATNATSMAAALKYRFHDVTTHSFSVLSDTYAGGLRKDLTRTLENTTYGPTSATTLWTTTATDTTFIPTWGHLRSFYSQTATGGIITPRLPVYGNGIAGEIGVSPVITYAALGFRYASALAPADNGKINFNLYPLIVLWNPYTNTLAGQDYEIGIGHLASNARVKLEVESAPGTWTIKEIRDLRYAGKVVATENSNTGQPVEYFRFKVRVPNLAAGESVVFTLNQDNTAGTDVLYSAGNNLMVPGMNHYRYVSLQDAIISAGESTLNYRFAPAAGSAMRSGTNAELSVYLGDGTAPPVTATGFWDPTQNRWYQSMQRIDYQGIAPSYAEFSGPEQLRESSIVDDPAVKMVIMSTFSGTGKSYTLNNSFGTNIPRYRWIAQANIRAPSMFRSRFDPSFVVPYYSRISTIANLWPTWYLQNTSDPEHTSSGYNHDYDIGTNTAPDKFIKATLFEVRDASTPLVSVGQLQHANLSLAGSYPAYAVGNSIADFRLRNTAWIDEAGVINTSGQVAAKHPRYSDISWLLNRTLWDRYYFSTVPASGTVPDVLANPRLIRYAGATDADLRADADAPASKLLLSGGFNINSTSEQAWRAILGGINQLAYDPLTGTESSTKLGIALSRFSKPVAGIASPTNVAQDSSFNGGESTYAYYKGDDMKSLWQGYRVLSADQIAQLARNIVAEIRTRGPFISLGDFINRRLIDSTPFVDAAVPYEVRSTLTATQKAQFLAAMKGALQAAIDATPRTTAAGASFAINDMNVSSNQNDPSQPVSSISNDTSYWAVTRTVPTLVPGTLTYYSQPLARGDLTSSTAMADKTPQRNTAAFSPKFLTQADILSNIGASLSARSDTFTIRTYGETLNPATADITGRAWCEAVVQRIPDYVDSTAGTGNAATDAVGTLTDTNKKYGRQFKIISFRWLSPDDI
jgi:hypothetical protein